MNQSEICLTHFLFKENCLKTICYIATAFYFGLEYVIGKVEQNDKTPTKYYISVWSVLLMLIYWDKIQLTTHNCTGYESICTRQTNYADQ